jgi:hypothetical protein
MTAPNPAIRNDEASASALDAADAALEAGATVAASEGPLNATDDAGGPAEASPSPTEAAGAPAAAEAPTSPAKAFFAFLDANADAYGYDAEEGTTNKVVAFATLKAAYPHLEFATSNGSGWSRNDGRGPFGGLVVHRERGKDASGQWRTIGIRLDGRKPMTHTAIRGDIKRVLESKRCVVLGTKPMGGCQIDHKNGRKVDQDWGAPDSQKIVDFQPLTMAVNIAKREHCRDCKSANRRFDARHLGYLIGWTHGAEPYVGTCKGCYWNDPQDFNAKISRAEFVARGEGAEADAEKRRKAHRETLYEDTGRPKRGKGGKARAAEASADERGEVDANDAD